MIAVPAADQVPVAGAPVYPITVRFQVGTSAGADTTALPFAVGSIVTPQVLGLAVFNGLLPIAGSDATFTSINLGGGTIRWAFPTALVAPAALTAASGTCPPGWVFAPVPMPIPSLPEQTAWAAALQVTLNDADRVAALVDGLNEYLGPGVVTSLAFTTVTVGAPVLAPC
jgi:hypothetical protein